MRFCTLSARFSVSFRFFPVDYRLMEKSVNKGLNEPPS